MSLQRISPPPLGRISKQTLLNARAVEESGKCIFEIRWDLSGFQT